MFENLEHVSLFVLKQMFRARIHKMYVRIPNREDPEQTDLVVPCLSMPFCQATSVQNFRTFTVVQSNNIWFCHLQNIFILAVEPDTCV